MERKNDFRQNAFALLTGMCQTQVIFTLVTSNVFETIDDGECSLEKIANKCHLNKKILLRTLRYTVMLGLLAMDDDKYLLTETGRFFLKKQEDGFFNLTNFLGSAPWRESWNNFDHCLTTGQPAFDDVFGMPFIEYLDLNPQYRNLHNYYLEQRSKEYAGKIAASYPFNSFKLIYELGQGDGILLNTIIKRSSDTNALLIQTEPSEFSEELSERIRVVNEASLDHLPKTDCLILNGVLSEWEDTRCIQILTTARKLLKPGGKLLLIDRTINEEPPFDPETVFLDLHMQVMEGGLERTVLQYEKLVQKAGLRLNEIYSTPTPMKLLEIMQ